MEATHELFIQSAPKNSTNKQSKKNKLGIKKTLKTSRKVEEITEISDTAHAINH